MKKFNEIDGFKDLKIRTDFCELKSAVYGVNGTIRKYLQSYAFPPLVEQLIIELTEYGVSIKNIKINDRNKKQQEDALNEIRALVLALQAYRNQFRFNETCVSAIKASASYQLQRFLKERENNRLTIDFCLELLRRNKLIHLSIKEVEKSLNTTINLTNFIKLQDDIKRELQKLIDTYDFV